MRLNHLFLLSALIGALTFFGCGDDDNDEVTLRMQFEHKFGSEDAVYGSVYEIDGIAMRFDLGMFYCSHFTPKDDSGDAITSFTDEYILVRADEPTIHEIGTFNAKSVKGLGFRIGVESSVNHGDPANWTSPHPLSSQSPSMYWGWDNGYIFFKFEGRVDTDEDGEPNAPVLYHIGKDDFFELVDISVNEATVDGVMDVIVTVDYEKLFTNIDFTVDRVNHTNIESLHIATQLAENWPSMFE